MVSQTQRHTFTLWHNEHGVTLFHALLVASILGVIAVSFIGKVTYEQRDGGRLRKATQAFYLAEAAVNQGIALLDSEGTDSFPYYEQDVPLGKGTYSLTLDCQQAQQGAYQSSLYTLRGEGKVADTRRAVEVGFRQHSLLRFSRFVQSSDLTYEEGAVISGNVWVGSNLTLAAYPVIFLRDVSAGGQVVYPKNGVFRGKRQENAEPIDLKTTVDMVHYSNLALGNIKDSGTGIYQAASSKIDLTYFDFREQTPTYMGRSLGQDFNGVVHTVGDVYIRGTLTGGSVTIVATDDIVIVGDVLTGTAIDGTPVNIGLVAGHTIYIESYTPREITIDAALLARDGNWQALGTDETHDGTSWVLTINGPIITYVEGSAGPWSNGTRHYNYDEDIVDYPPPHFPILLGKWSRLYWREIPPGSLG